MDSRYPRVAGLPKFDITQRSALRIALLVLLAAAHRIIIVAWTPVIAADGAFYLQAAKDFAAGNIELALEHSRLHPLHMILTATLRELLGSFEAAGYTVSILAGSLAVIPLFALVRMVWNERVAVATSILYALHPTFSLEGSEVLNTGLYQSLLVTSVTCIVMALADRNWLCYPVAGLLGALAYLTRPEGVILGPMALVAIVTAIVIRIRLRRPLFSSAGVEENAWLSWVRLLGGIVTAVSIFVIFAAPYLIWLERTTGSWCLTSRGAGLHATKSFQEDLPTQNAIRAPESATATGAVPVPPAPAKGPAQPPPAATNSAPPVAPAESSANAGLARLNTIQKKYVGACYPPLFPFAVIGLLVCRRQGGTWRSLAPLWGMVLLNSGVVFGTAWRVPAFHFSDRYFMSGILFLLPWAAAGLLAVEGWINAILQKRVGPRIGRKVSWVPYALLLVLAGTRTLGPRRADQVVYLEAGAWLKQHGGSLTRNVLSTTEKIPYYGGFRPLAAPEGVAGVRWLYRNRWFERADNGMPQETVSDRVRQTRIGYQRYNCAFLTLDEARSSKHRLPPGFLAELERVGFRPVARFDNELPKMGRTVTIYRLED